jgi:hypothetical protein
MPKIIKLSPEQLHEIADNTEDKASALPPCARRDQMMERVWRMRREANLAQWMGIEALPAEVEEAHPITKLW